MDGLLNVGSRLLKGEVYVANRDVCLLSQY